MAAIGLACVGGVLDSAGGMQVKASVIAFRPGPRTREVADEADLLASSSPVRVCTVITNCGGAARAKTGVMPYVRTV